jgi:hypothetical protein
MGWSSLKYAVSDVGFNYSDASAKEDKSFQNQIRQPKSSLAET